MSMENRFLVDSSINDAALQEGFLTAKVVINTSTTRANILYSIMNCKADNGNGAGIIAYGQIGTTQPVPYDTAAAFPVFDNTAAPSVMGFVFYVRDALEIININVPTLTVTNTGGNAMTAGVPTLRGTITGGLSTGVTPSGNISFSLSTTGLTYNTNIGTATFNVEVRYRRKQNFT